MALFGRDRPTDATDATDELPSIEQYEAAAEREIEEERRAKIRAIANRRRNEDELRLGMERNQRIREEKGRRERQRELEQAAKAHVKLYGRERAAQLDPAATYDLVPVLVSREINRSGKVIYAFTSSALANQARDYLRECGSAPEPGGLRGVAGTRLGAVVPGDQLLAVDPSRDEIAELGGKIQAVLDRRQQAATESAKREAAEQRRRAEERQFGVAVSE